MTQVAAKRKFLIVTADKSLQEQLKSWIEKYVSNSHCVFSTDGSDAISKIQNDPPHAVITSINLAKTDGYKLTQWVLRCMPDEKIAIILLAPVPTIECFVDEVVNSQVQFADLSKGESEMQTLLLRAINFVFHSDKQQEFFTHFVAEGEHLIKQGEKAYNVYLVKTGELVASIQKGQSRVILGTISPGEFVGEMSYINGEPRSADVFASTACELIAIPVNILDQVLFTKPAWAKALMKTLTKRLKQANKKAS